MSNIEIPTIPNSMYRFINLIDAQAIDTFASDIGQGLAASEKYIHNKYMYNADGSDIFEKITQDKNYYPNHAETEILTHFASEIAAKLADNTAVIELGSGSAAKTRRLLEALLQKQNSTLFCPIDISGDFLQENVKCLSSDYPDLQILGVIADYYAGLTVLANEIKQPKLLLWLGSDIGHTDREQAASLLREKMLPVLKPGDKLLLGIDLKKAVEPINLAYGCPGDNEPLRYSFNCNALRRINRQLGGNFIPEAFQRYCFYNAIEGRVEIYLKSLYDQQVTITALAQTFSFKADELIRIHFAYKYNQTDIVQLANTAGLNVEQQWFDDKHWYSLNLLGVKDS